MSGKKILSGLNAAVEMAKAEQERRVAEAMKRFASEQISAPEVDAAYEALLDADDLYEELGK